MKPDELRAVTPDAKAKTHFLIVDCVGVTERPLSDTKPLDKNPSVSLKVLLDHVAAGGVKDDYLSSLASRLVRIEKQCGSDDKKLIDDTSGGLSLASISSALVAALDADQQDDAARRMFHLSGADIPTEAQIEKAAAPLKKAAIRPLMTTTALRKLILDLRKKFEQIADDLAVHAAIEEKHFYPATKSARTEDLLQEAVEEHLSVKRIIADLLEMDPAEAQFDAKIGIGRTSPNDNWSNIGAESLDQAGIKPASSQPRGGVLRNLTAGATEAITVTLDTLSDPGAGVEMGAVGLANTAVLVRALGERQAQHLDRVVAGDAGGGSERHRGSAAAGDDAPLGPGQLSEALAGRLHQLVQIDEIARRLGDRRPVVRKAQNHLDRCLHARAGPVVRRCQHRRGLGTQESASHVHGVAAHVPDDAACRTRIETDIVSGWILKECEADAHDTWVADRAGPHHLFCLAPSWREAIHKRLHHAHIISLGRRANRIPFFDRHRQRLLTQHVLARIRAANGPFCMEMIGHRKIDRIDLGICQELLI